MIWKPGQLIQQERYVIEEVLGVGGFGITYRAREKESNHLIAIKTPNDLRQNQTDFAAHQEKFIKEAFRLAKCNHNHIVQVKDICQEKGLWCMIMDYIADSNLEQYVIEQGVLSKSQALKYINQIGNALDYIHQQGLLHRDVKPSNIMLRRNNTEAVLIDFGLAREFIVGKAMTQTNSRTECYAPIEQYRQKAERGAYTDVYALAATFYYLLTAVEPLPAQFRWQGANLIPPQRHNCQISDRLNRAIITGMALEPEKRPQSVPEWLELLNQSQKSATQSNLAPDQYRRLKRLLNNKQWRQADEETYEIILKQANRVKEGWLDYGATERLPCQLLQELDNLWVKYSQGRFGFSIQRRIWQGLGGKIDYETECRLGENLGWRVNKCWQHSDRLNFSLNAPLGHLPWDGHMPQDELKELGLTGTYSRWWCCLILSRCAECQV